MKKLKPLMPSLREKKRYLVFEIITESTPDYKDVAKEIDISTKNILGTMDLAKAGVIHIPKRYDAEKKKGMIRVNNKYVEKIITSLGMIKTIAEKDAIIRCTYVSGTIKKANSKL